ncbi:ROK family protein [Corynebacterium sp. sy039]|uniref:ROK family protein n=1 Tax=Corynebacterium sp. sy039 TaxID=2599641 RepID=UPI0011B40317|nr:ROK family protein [Corynebacterium sp. sy039]QDZ41777.1 ROK family protein [Corynebacterium sp. sy039]
MRNKFTVASTPAFARPQTPAAVCMHITRLQQPVTRQTIVKLSQKSQPTVTRAIKALIDAQLIKERHDLSTIAGPGRPTIPIQLNTSPWVQIGIAVGTHSTYIGAYNIRGQVLREKFVDITVAQIHPKEFITHLTPHIHGIIEGIGLPLANLGIATSGTVNADGLVTAPNLGWDRVDISNYLHNQFAIPITITSVITAIAGAEQQLQSPEKKDKVLLFYVDDSNGAAILTTDGVYRLDVAKTDSRVALGAIAVALAKETKPDTIVLAGSAFAQQTDARKVGHSIKHSYKKEVELRVIPTHLDNARAAARAVALDRLINDPLGIAGRMRNAKVKDS